MRRLLSLGRCGAQSLGCGRHPCLCADTSSTCGRSDVRGDERQQGACNTICPLSSPQLDTNTQYFTTHL